MAMLLKQFDDLKSAIADTPTNHVSSQKCFKRNGFTLLSEVEDGLRWKLEEFNWRTQAIHKLDH